MRRIILLAALLTSLSLTLIRLSPSPAVRASASAPASTAVAPPQAQGPRPIRTLPGLEEIRVWVGRDPLTREFFCPPNHPQILERRATLDSLNKDTVPFGEPGDYYDVFYSHADGTPNVDGAYVTLEAVSNKQAPALGGGNVAEVGLRFAGSTTFEYGNVVASFVALGNNADPALNSNAIDGNTQTSSTLGNTVGQSRRLRITIGFTPSGIDCPGCRFLNISIFMTHDIFSPLSVQLSAYDSSCDKALGVVLEVVVTNDSGEGDFRRTVTTDSNGVAQFGYSRGKISVDQITVTGTTQEGGHFQCVQQVEWVQNQTCPLENSLQGVPNARATLTGARAFRDSALARTQRGQTYTWLYYQFSSETVQIMMFNPVLLLRSREIIERYKPVIQSMARGEQVTLTRGDLDDVDGFLNSFAAKGSPQLQQAVKEVCEDLKTSSVHDEFHITVVEGPKREMPAHHLLQIIERAGGTSGFLGFCVVCAFFLVRRHDKSSRTKAKACRLLLQRRKTGR